MRPIKVFTVIPMASIGFAILTLAGCPGDTGDTDSGVPDSGTSEPDVGPEVGPEAGDVGDSCTVGAATGTEDGCKTDLLCYPNALNPAVGTCRVQCGQLVGGVPEETDPSPCTGTDTCQTVIAFDEQNNAGLVGIACLPQQTARDGQCLGINDPDSCAASIATAAGVDVAQLDCAVTTDVTEPFFCKIGCELGAAGADESCPTGEACLPDGTGRLTVELSDEADPESTIACVPADCAAGNCTCSGAFECINTTIGNLCAAQLGTCGNAVAPTYNADFQQLIDNGPFNQDLFCNAVDDHRLCDTGFYDGAENPGSMQCIGISAQSNDGVCFALCGFPATSDDPEDAATLLDCPANHECTDVLSVSSGVGFFKDDPPTCNPANCTAGEPCPSECGAGDWQCVNGFGNAPVCFAPVGTCEPAGEPPVDAGPTDAGVDAGPVDAGDDAGVIDAGTTDAGVTDAGTTDAGVTDAGTTDAGTTDAGVTDAG